MRKGLSWSVTCQKFHLWMTCETAISANEATAVCLKEPKLCIICLTLIFWTNQKVLKNLIFNWY